MPGFATLNRKTLGEVRPKHIREKKEDGSKLNPTDVRVY
jgi:hypothetical protein